MASKYVVWDEENNQVIQVPMILGQGAKHNHSVMLNKFCIRVDDTPTGDDMYKYGKWTIDAGGGSCRGWVAIPFEDFPSEFKLQLTLLGFI